MPDHEQSREELCAELRALRLRVAELEAAAAASPLREALRQSEDRFRAILEDVHMVAVQGYDEERRVTFWNAASECLYGYSREEALGRKLEDLIIPDFMRGEVVFHVTRWMEEGVPIPAGHLHLRRKDGKLVPVYSSHVMQESSTRKKEMFCIDVDFTEIEATHRELVQAKEDAEAASTAKSMFLANMSHEIRTPINGVLGMLQLLRHTPLNGEQDEYLRIAIRSSTRLTSLLSDILDLSSIEAGKIMIHEAAFDLSEVQISIRDLLGLAASQKGLDLEFVTDPRLPRRLIGDEIRLRQILFNLVGNAIKFSSRGFVRVESTALPYGTNGDQRVLFCISDTGSGIPDERLREIFEPFVQGENSYVRDHQGAGLGLAIAKRLVGLMRGTMAVESSPAGTTICFSLPFRLPQVTVKDQSLDLVQPVTKSGARTILVAEDDEVSLLVVRNILEKRGYKIIAAMDGQQALQLLRTCAVDLVLMDVQMPILDGMEVTRRIRADASLGRVRNIPIIAMTSYAMLGDRQKIMASGMNDYIAKPLDMVALCRVIDAFLAAAPGAPAHGQT